MTLKVELTPSEEARLAAVAREEGVSPAEFARKLLTERLPPAAVNGPEEDPTLALFRQWGEEDARRTPDEADNENRLWEEFEANVNATRQILGMRQL